MNIFFFIGRTNTWNQKQATVLAREHARMGYNVRLLSTESNGIISEDGMRVVRKPFLIPSVLHGAWVLWYFATRRRGVVHIFGLRNGLLTLAIRVLHPASRILLHIDDATDTTKHSLFANVSEAIALRTAHIRVTSRKDLLHHEAFAHHAVQYFEYAIPTHGQTIDPSIMRAHGLELQQFFLAYVNPSDWSDMQMLIREWRTYLRVHLPDAKLAIAFTNDAPSRHIAFGHDVAVLGCVTPYVARMLESGARAVLVPSFAKYRMELISAMAGGKYAVPLHELVNRNPFVLEEMETMYQSADHGLTDLTDAALTMSWGHIARTIIASDHDPSVIVERYESLYEHLLFANSMVTKARLS